MRSDLFPWLKSKLSIHPYFKLVSCSFQHRATPFQRWSACYISCEWIMFAQPDISVAAAHGIARLVIFFCPWVFSYDSAYFFCRLFNIKLAFCIAISLDNQVDTALHTWHGWRGRLHSNMIHIANAFPGIPNAWVMAKPKRCRMLLPKRQLLPQFCVEIKRDIYSDLWSEFPIGNIPIGSTMQNSLLRIRL